jgi:hypothetical protein
LCLQRAVDRQPSQRDWVSGLQMALQQRGYASMKLGRGADYDSDVRRAEEVGQRLDPFVMRLPRINQRLQEAKWEQAAAEADDVFAGGELSPFEWHDLAAVYAQLTASAQAGERQEAFVQRAVGSLRKSLEGGYPLLRPLGDDLAFRPLWGRTDFRQLQTVKAAGPPRP